MFGLLKRNGSYYFRLRVPADLASLLQRREIKKSFKTENFKSARLLSTLLRRELKVIFVIARVKLLSDDQIRQLC